MSTIPKGAMKRRIGFRWKLLALVLAAILLLVFVVVAIQFQAGDAVNRLFDRLIPMSDKTNWEIFRRENDGFRVRRFLQWNGRIIAESDAFYSLDPGLATAATLQLPGAREIVDLASQGSERPIALCRDERGLFLLCNRDGQWSRLELPRTVRSSSEQVLLAADPHTIVVVGKGGIARFDADSQAAVWLQWPSEPIPVSRFPQHRLLRGGELYLGRGDGEFGGELQRIDIRSGDAEMVLHAELFNRLGQGMPLVPLALGPDGRIWALEGLAHGTIREGRLHVLSGGEWTLFCNSSKEQPINWSLPNASLQALAFDSIGRPVVLSGDLGLVRYDNGSWSRLTPNWPEFFYVCSLLLPRDGLAVIGTYHAGVMLLDLESGHVRRVDRR
jgi:hypothetical protein